jgi:hypothetical protein
MHCIPRLKALLPDPREKYLHTCSISKPFALQLNKKLVQMAHCEHACVSLSSRHGSKKEWRDRLAKKCLHLYSLVLHIPRIKGLLSVRVLCLTCGALVVTAGPEKGVKILLIVSSMNPNTLDSIKLRPGTIVIIPSTSLHW